MKRDMKKRGAVMQNRAAFDDRSDEKRANQATPPDARRRLNL
jgi:hypothetical protein